MSWYTLANVLLYTKNYIVICCCILIQIMIYFNSYIIYTTSNSCRGIFISCRGIITYDIYMHQLMSKYTLTHVVVNLTHVLAYTYLSCNINAVLSWYKLTHLTLTQLLLFYVTVYLVRTLFTLLLGCIYVLPFTKPSHVTNSFCLYVY